MARFVANVVAPAPPPAPTTATSDPDCVPLPVASSSGRADTLCSATARSAGSIGLGRYSVTPARMALSRSSVDGAGPRTIRCRETLFCVRNSASFIPR